MKTSEVAQLLGVSANTVRGWSWREFRQYLSPDAQGGDGSTREFSELDLQVLSHVSALSKRHKARELVHAELQSLQSDGWVNLPPLQLPPTKALTVPVTPIEAAQREIEIERRAFIREAAVLREQIDKLEQSKAADRETIIDLNRRLARAEQLAEMYESGRLTPPSKQ